ncbi:trichome birefringence-like protein 25 [Tanacetum coccineum]
MRRFEADVDYLLGYPRFAAVVESRRKHASPLLRLEALPCPLDTSVHLSEELVDTYERLKALDKKRMFALSAVGSHKKEVGRLRYYFDVLGSPNCDIFTGEWITCPFECKLSAFYLKMFLPFMRNKSMVFIGDSISRNQVQSLFCILSQLLIITGRLSHQFTIVLHYKSAITVIMLKNQSRCTTMRSEKAKDGCSTKIFVWFMRELEMIRVEMVIYQLRLASHALYKVITESFLNLGRHIMMAIQSGVRTRCRATLQRVDRVINAPERWTTSLGVHTLLYLRLRLQDFLLIYNVSQEFMIATNKEPHQVLA